MWGFQVMSVRRTKRTMRSVRSQCYDFEEEMEDSDEWGESRLSM